MMRQFVDVLANALAAHVVEAVGLLVVAALAIPLTWLKLRKRKLEIELSRLEEAERRRNEKSDPSQPRIAPPEPEKESTVPERPPSEPGIPAPYTLLAVVSKSTRKRFPLPIGESDVGTASSCNIQLTSSKVSSRHARFNVNSTGVTVTDLDSTNRTFVTTDSVKNLELESRTPAQLRPGDRIAFSKREVWELACTEPSAQAEHKDRTRLEE